MYQKTTPQSGNSYTHMWDVSTMKQFDGGFLFDKTCVPTGTMKVPKGALLKANFGTRKAVLVKTVTLHASLATNGTTVKIKKGHNLIATDIVGVNGNSVLVGTITSNTDYDSFTIVAGALGGSLPKDTVLQQYTAVGKTIPEVKKSAIIYEAVTTSTTVVKVNKGSGIAEGDTISFGGTTLVLGEITADENFDSFVITANKFGAIPVGAVMQVYSEGSVNTGTPINPDGLNPFDVLIDDEPSCSIMFRADGVVKSRLPQGITPEIEEALNNIQFLDL